MRCGKGDGCRYGLRIPGRMGAGETGGLRVTIGDTGSGIPAEVLPTIFEPFVTTKGETGTGLGLWVTSEIIKKNGWKIRVRSCVRAGCSGTVFSVVIPRISPA